MVDSSYTRSGKIRYWQKFSVAIILGLILLSIAGMIGNNYLYGVSIFVLLVSMWFGLLSIIEFLDKINN